MSASIIKKGHKKSYQRSSKDWETIFNKKSFKKFSNYILSVHFPFTVNELAMDIKYMGGVAETWDYKL